MNEPTPAKPPTSPTGPQAMMEMFGKLAEKIDPAQLQQIAGFAQQITDTRADVKQLDANIRFLNQKLNLILDKLGIERPKAP